MRKVLFFNITLFSDSKKLLYWFKVGFCLGISASSEDIIHAKLDLNLISWEKTLENLKNSKFSSGWMKRWWLSLISNEIEMIANHHQPQVWFNLQL